MSRVVETRTPLSVGELPDADAVGRMEMLSEKVAARLQHLGQLQEPGERQKAFHRFLLEFEVTYGDTSC